MKDSFILYNSFYDPIKTLKNEQLGKLFRSIFNYTINGEITQDNDILVAFMFIKNQIDLDAKKWQDIKQKRSEAGKRHKGNQYTTKRNKMEQNGTNGSVNENVNVNVNDNVNIKETISKDIAKKIEKKYFESLKVNTIFNEFLELRKKLKAVNTDRAINMLINKLNEYDEETQYEMIEQSIVNSWKGIFELKNKKNKGYSFSDLLKEENYE